MNNIENILNAIIQEAEEKAKEIINESEIEYNKKFNEIEILLQQELENKKKAVDEKFFEQVSRAEKSANLEKTKLMLEFKQKILDRIFSAVLNNLCNLEQHQYEKLIENLLINYAKPEDAVALSQDSKVDENFITSLNVFKQKQLKYIYSKMPIKGGFVLINSICDTVVSFESIVDEYKEKYAYKLSNELFN